MKMLLYAFSGALAVCSAIAAAGNALMIEKQDGQPHLAMAIVFAILTVVFVLVMQRFQNK